MDVVIFGDGGFADLFWYVLTNDSPHRVVGFTVDRDYLAGHRKRGLPIVAFDEVEKHFDPDGRGIAVGIGWHNANGLRAAKHAEAAAKGYAPVSYISSRSLVWPDLEMGAGCTIFEGAVVQPFARLGDGVILRSGANISHHVVVGDFSFISANAAIGGGARLGARCFVGLNATVRDNIEIGERSVIGAAAYIAGNLKPDSKIAGPIGTPIRGRGTARDGRS